MGESIREDLEIIEQPERKFNIVKFFKKIKEGIASIKPEQEDIK